MSKLKIIFFMFAFTGLLIGFQNCGSSEKNKTSISDNLKSHGGDGYEGGSVSGGPCPEGQVFQDGQCRTIDGQRTCKADNTRIVYLETALKYFLGAKGSVVEQQARECHDKLKPSLDVLKEQNWPCQATEDAFNYTFTCIEKVIKPALQNAGLCQVFNSDIDYLYNGLIYLEGAKRTAMSEIARQCHGNISRSVDALEAQDWPCQATKETLKYALTCIEEIVKPGLGH